MLWYYLLIRLKCHCVDVLWYSYFVELSCNDFVIEIYCYRVFSETALWIFLIFCMILGNYKSRKVTQPDFCEKLLIWRYSRKGLQISPKSDTLIFFSKTAPTIFLVFGLKLLLNMTFNLNETYFSEKCATWRYLTSKSSKKNAQIEVFGHFIDLASLVFHDFAHSDMWAWCLVVFLQFAGPVKVFSLLYNFIVFLYYNKIICYYVMVLLCYYGTML